MCMIIIFLVCVLQSILYIQLYSYRKRKKTPRFSFSVAEQQVGSIVCFRAYRNYKIGEVIIKLFCALRSLKINHSQTFSLVALQSNSFKSKEIVEWKKKKRGIKTLLMKLENRS